MLQVVSVGAQVGQDCGVVVASSCLKVEKMIRGKETEQGDKHGEVTKTEEKESKALWRFVTSVFTYSTLIFTVGSIWTVAGRREGAQCLGLLQNGIDVLRYVVLIAFALCFVCKMGKTLQASQKCPIQRTGLHNPKPLDC